MYIELSTLLGYYVTINFRQRKLKFTQLQNIILSSGDTPTKAKEVCGDVCKHRHTSPGYDPSSAFVSLYHTRATQLKGGKVDNSTVYFYYSLANR